MWWGINGNGYCARTCNEQIRFCFVMGESVREEFLFCRCHLGMSTYQMYGYMDTVTKYHRWFADRAREWLEIECFWEYREYRTKV